ncbi:autotransporter outer membrane beta-barrel domain-containing protein [Bartonella sp. MM73XJBT.G]|uniref:autotransporter family protein n=1 Tax=Bartonella sp. MM73XJBT.G TaxID=3019097 RepID=UPI002361D178|nr:autotransporter outer membrane beta-barrel domain-containing protein [Bartonella sp. MM73XJBT.G]
MCKKYIYKKNFLLCTIAGTFIFSHLAPTHANIQPSEIPTIQVTNGEEKNLNNVFIRGKYDAVVARKGHVTIANSIMHSGFTLLSATLGGQINAKGIIGRAEERGLSLTNGIIHVENSTINVIGHSKISGINFGYILSSTIQEGEEVVNKAILNNTKLLVKNGVGIFGPSYSKAAANAVYLKNSEIRSDMLLENGGSPFTEVQPTTFTLDADNSIMEGRAKTLPQNTTIFTLNNNSKWHLKISLFELESSFSLFDYKLLDLKQRAQSVVSVLNLNDSSIIFDAPHKLADNHYQTLHIGRHPQKTDQNRSSNGTVVYNATGNARIYFNTEWSNGLPKEQQKTDRVLIRGDVSGTTTVYFNNLSKHAESFDNEKAKDSIPLNERGLSLIQVSGHAHEDSFKLAHGYTTIGGLPYKYILNSYGPTSRLGKADNQQSLFPEDGEFWDFRLQNATLDLVEEIKALVPQVASYLVMPNAIFSSGLTDISNQNTLLDNMHSTVFGLEGHKKKGIFLSTYGNKVTLSSSRSPLEYGYGADVGYAALQAGMTLATLENQNLTVNFGLLGTYGKLAFTPKDMEGSDKSILDKWSFTAYGNLHHDNGLYINALLSYGVLNGHITTALIGNTTELNNTDILNISATVGQKLATGVEGLSFEPQAQLIYQHIAFGTLSDIDGFQVNIKTPHQWLVRMGGRLTKTILPIEKDRVLSFYGKLNVIKAFGEKSTIDIVEPFRLDSMGSSLEGGLGINAQLSKNIALHADVNYQHKLQKSGISGVNFSGGMRYRF